MVQIFTTRSFLFIANHADSAAAPTHFTASNLTSVEAAVKKLVEAIAKALVDYPEDVRVRVVEGEQVTVFELRTHPDDLGKVIGRQGRTVKAIRTILEGVGMKERKHFILEILD